ncbi:MAG: MFS transporter [Geodermatophilaceae bacterium]|nr:MFS transporter [Geodermatophilaceae bacterium]
MAGDRASYRDALRQRDYRLLITAFLIDSVGGWAYNVVLIVYVFDRTGSPTWISVFLAASWVPKMLLAPYAGLLADRHERTRIMLASALSALAVMGAIAALVYVDAPLLLILLLAIALAVCVTPYNPAAQALLIDAVGEKDLPAANALFLTVESLVIVIGPAIGGLLLLTGEPVTAMALNALTFLVTALIVIRIQTRSRGGALEEASESRVRQLTAGLRALRSEPVATVLVLYCLLCTAAAATTSVLYVQLSQQFGTGTEGYSYLLAGFALGGVASASVTNRLAAGRLAAPVLAGMLLLSLPFIVTIWVEGPILGTLLQVLAGAGMVIVDVLAITALQRQMPRAVMSRVFALLDAGVYAASIVGSFVTAALLGATDVRTTLLVLGLGFSALSIAGIRPLVLADRRSVNAVAALQPRIALLQQLDLFAVLPRTALEELARSLAEVQAEPGEVLIREGADADALWILLTGQVEVLSQGESRHPQQLPSLGPGSYFGEIGLLRGVPRTATVRTTEPSTLYRVAAEPFLEAVQGGRASSSLLAIANTRLARSHPRLSTESMPAA